MGHINVATRCEELWHETGLYEGERQGIKLDGSGTISDEAGRGNAGPAGRQRDRMDENGSDCTRRDDVGKARARNNGM